MNLIYVMRHAQSVVNMEHRLTGRTFDGDLTPLGREQAAKAGVWLLDKSITNIVTAFSIAPLKPRKSSATGLDYLRCLMRI